MSAKSAPLTYTGNIQLDYSPPKLQVKPTVLWDQVDHHPAVWQVDPEVTSIIRGTRSQSAFGVVDYEVYPFGSPLFDEYLFDAFLEL
jgi:hypothetical protein